jgi:hypothetical protein
MNLTLYRRAPALLLVSVLPVAMPSAALADEVLDWNAIAVRAMQVAPAVPGPLQARFLAIVHAAIFDAVNGIERRFTPIHVDAEAPPDASRRAAAVQAAYTVLVSFFPSQAAALDADLEASLAGIAADATENSQSIQRGRDWGEQVALAILAWRENDGLNPPAPTYLGRLEPGIWRPTPRPNPDPSLPELPGLPGLAPSLAYTQPFVIPSPSSFRPAGPPPLTSQEYADDVNEVQSVGALVSDTRTADQTESARFWAGAAASIWNRAAVSVARERNTTLSQNARLFALLNIAAADAIIATWDAKYYFEFWRPITAIRLASTDGNPATIEQSNWVPLIVTPPYPEYPSGHQSISGAAQAVLTAYFGAATPFEAFSEGLPGVVRSWPDFATAADEASLARIWAGIHFRFAMRDTREVVPRRAGMGCGRRRCDHSVAMQRGRQPGVESGAR